MSSEGLSQFRCKIAGQGDSASVINPIRFQRKAQFQSTRKPVFMALLDKAKGPSLL
jgi:hypothetical protein